MSDAFNPFDAAAAAAAATDGTISSDSQKKNGSWDATNTTMNTTFESDAFEFSAADDADFSANIFQAPFLFPDDPFDVPKTGEKHTIHVALHEQLTCLYEGNDNAPSSQVEGTIHVRSSTSAPFHLLMRDQSSHLESFREDPKYCTTALSKEDGFLDDRLLTITLPNSLAKKQKIASYTCNETLLPIPLLVKNKVLVEGDRCRVGIKVRSNPANQRHLTQVAILMAVPPDIRGESVKLTRQGGVWDGMKRIVAWPIDRGLAPGELIEIQAQFSFVSPTAGFPRPLPTFPILVRCDGSNDQFSDVQLCTDMHESRPSINMSLTRTVRIIHRKV